MPEGAPYSSKTPTNGVEDNRRMSFTVFLGNLPAWVTADDIKGWLSAENLVADAIKVIRNPETQESKGFAFIEAPNTEEMNSIIRRFDRAPLEDRLLRANPAQPPKPKGAVRPDERGRGPERGPERGGAIIALHRIKMQVSQQLQPACRTRFRRRRQQRRWPISVRQDAANGVPGEPNELPVVRKARLRKN